MAKIIFLLALAVVVDAAVTNAEQTEMRVSSSCGKKVHLSQATKTKRSSHPAFAQIMNPGYPGTGVGLKTIKGEILKDGYFPFTCQKDYLLEFGDKYGPNKHAYKIGGSAGVSIVRYEDWNAKADQVEMSIKVCFDFCRTVPGMQFFGLFAGRECYCAPYTQMLASDNKATCDAPCPGDTTQMCGGMAKSSIFSMHMCGDTEENLAEFDTKGSDVAKSMKELIDKAKAEYVDWKATALSRQEKYGQFGDTGASDSMQAAKVAAGDFEKVIEAAKKTRAALNGALKAAKKAKGVKEGEAAISAGETALAEAEAAEEELTEAFDNIKAPEDALKGSLESYSTLMYLVDKKHQDDISTCGGTIMGWIINGNEEQCAHACNNRPLHCVGFGFFPSGKRDICALFSKFTDVTYYTDGKCAGFLQKAKPGPATKCYAKFAALGEKDLAPDASGKCKHCLKTAVEKDACLKAKKSTK